MSKQRYNLRRKKKIIESESEEEVDVDVLSTETEEDEDFESGDELSEEDFAINIANQLFKRINEQKTEYLASHYLTEGWKEELEQDDIDKIEEELNKLIQEMRSDIPTMKDVIHSELSKEDKKDLIYSMDLLKDLDPNEVDHYELLQEIRAKLNSNSELKFGLKLKDEYEQEILNLNTNEETKKEIYKFYIDMKNCHPDEYKSKMIKLRIFLTLPFNTSCKIGYEKKDHFKFIQECTTKLDAELYGMDIVKKKFLTVLSNKMLDGNSKGCAIALRGPPGVGKTHISRVFANCLGLPFHQITIGGARDGTILTGSDNHWVGSSHGQIADALIKMKCNNGVIFIDEIDKAETMQVFNIINHLIDFTSNCEFEDNFLREIKLDLSKIWFVLSLNDSELLPKYVSDRMDFIDVPPYEKSEKFEICKNFFIPKFMKNNQISFTDDAIQTIVDKTREEGVREISHMVSTICSKLNLNLILNKGTHKYADIPDMKLPFIVNSKIVHLLLSDKKSNRNDPPAMLYI